MLYEDRQGTLWIATETGLDRFDPATGGFDHVRHDPTDPTTLGSSTVWTLYEDRAGRFWVGTYGGGLALLDRATGRATRYTFDLDDPTSIGSNIVTVIHEREVEPGVLWIGTAEGGLSRFDTATGRFERIGRREGLPDLNVKSMLEDEAGHLWLGTGEGLVRFDPDTRAVTVFTTADGLPEVTFGLFDAMVLHDGSFLFGTQRHVVRFRPEAVEAGAFEAPVVMTEIEVAGQPMRLGPRPEGLRIPWTDRTLAFGFAALHFAAPEHTRYRYQLDGFDADWLETDGRRYSAYTNLPPGRYTFRVRATSSSGVESPSELAVPVEIVPPFWMTAWFRGLVVLFLAGGLVLTVRHFATRRLRRRVQAQEVALRLQRERERISQDLHDHVGAQLSNMLAGIELARLARRSSGDGAPPDPETDPLNGVEADARTTMRQLRETIWALHHETVSLDAFAEQVRRELARRARYHEHLTVSVGVASGSTDCTLSPVQALHLFRIAQEAITNALKHADAERLTVTLACDGAEVMLLVEDDGVFKPPAGGDGLSGYGLAGMRTRAEEIGGVLVLTTENGTTIRVTVPRRTPERIPASGD